MKRKDHSLFSNISFWAGIFIIIYVVNESLQHRMNWGKIALFWIGFSGIAYFLLHRFFARLQTFRQNRLIYKYRRSHRIGYLIILIAGIISGLGFSYSIWAGWHKPAVYWELAEESFSAPHRYRVSWRIGNQRFRESVQLGQIRLVELANVSLNDDHGQLSINCRIDSLTLAAKENKDEQRLEFDLPQGFRIPPLESYLVEFDFDCKQRFAIYEAFAVYDIAHVSKPSKNGRFLERTSSSGRYLVIDSPDAELVEFEGLAKRFERSSAKTRKAFILALGRSKRPQALSLLLELLHVKDLRIQNTVCKALAELGDDRAVPALIKLAKESDNSRALRTLGALGADETAPFLTEIIADTSRAAFIRMTAASVIGEARLYRSLPALADLVRHNRLADVSVEYEVLLAIASLNRDLAARLLLENANKSHKGEALSALIAVAVDLDCTEMLPHFLTWLRGWREHELQVYDVQRILSYLSTGEHRRAVGTLIEVLTRERDTFLQAEIVNALSRLTGEHFGNIQYPALNSDMHAANRRIVEAWRRWWETARHDSAYLEQVASPEVMDQM